MLRSLFAVIMTAAAVIPLLGEDVHVYAWRVEFVEQVVHLEIQFKVVFTAFVVAFAEPIDVEIPFKERASEKELFAISAKPLNTLAREWILVQVLVRGRDHISFKGGTF